MRKIEILNKNNNWVEIDFCGLRKGDIFRIFDNGKRFCDKKGNKQWTAISEPYITETGIYQINTKEI
ncbi:MAG: hypothetical protein LIR50_12820 [Bacillota bacterium]|nr:hypothetical protein [Bacillota bacterium]